MLLKRLLLTILLCCSFLRTGGTNQLHAQETGRVGMHILHPEELTASKELLQVQGSSDQWQYVTIPFTYDDLHRVQAWKSFFKQAKDLRVIPIVRLATKVENGNWVVPDRKHIVEQIDFLSRMDWPTAERRIIAYNEVNHAKEWGGSVNPEEYARILRFVSDWAHTQSDVQFVVLPAAMDLAASSTGPTREAFAFLQAMQAANPGIFETVDAWNSHSYPNPGFAAAPQLKGKNSLRGFEHELAYLKTATGRDFQVYITETGWETSKSLERWLPAYYLYAVQHIWSHPQVVAVTPFVLRGSPGPFAGFSFLDDSNQPTPQYRALRAALEYLRLSTTVEPSRVSAVLTD